MQQWMTDCRHFKTPFYSMFVNSAQFSILTFLNRDTTQLKKLVVPENFRHNPMPDPDDRGWSPDSMDEGLQGSKDVSDRSLGYFWRKNRNFNWPRFLIPGLESLTFVTVGQRAEVLPRSQWLGKLAYKNNSWLQWNRWNQQFSVIVKVWKSWASFRQIIYLETTLDNCLQQHFKLPFKVRAN